MQKTISGLINTFVELAINYHRAILDDDWREVNKNARRLHKTFLHIVEIGDEAREALLAETENENKGVALMAATYSLKYNPQRAMEVLKGLSNLPGQVGFGAEQTLKRWEEGTWQLE